MVYVVVVIAKPKNHQQALGLEKMLGAWSQRNQASVSVDRLWGLSEEDYRRLRSAIFKAIEEVCK